MYSLLQQLLLLYSIFVCFNFMPQISFARTIRSATDEDWQYHYVSGITHRRRPSHLIINSIRRLRPLKAVAAAGVTSQTFTQQHKKTPEAMNTVGSGSFRRRLLNALEQAYIRSATQTSSHSPVSLSELRNALPRAVSPILEPDNGEQPEVVKPTLRPAATTAVPLMTSSSVAPIVTTTPILLSRISLPAESDEAKRARTQARWRKLGPLVKSIQYPYTWRNLHRIVIADNDALRISDTVRRIVEQRLRQRADTLEQRPRANGILLSNADSLQQKLTDKVDEQPKGNTVFEISTTAIAVTKFDNEIPITSDFPSTTDQSAVTTTPIGTTVTTTTTSAASTSATSKNELTGMKTETEQLPFLFSTPPSDYHFRKITPARKFKFTQKLRRQPRLRIRKPGDPGTLKGNSTAFGRKPLTLPHLAPISIQNEMYNGQRQMESGTNGFSSGSSKISEFRGVASPETPASPLSSSEISLGGTAFGNGDVKEEGSALMGFGGGRQPSAGFSEFGFAVSGGNGEEQQQQSSPPTEATEGAPIVPHAEDMSTLEGEQSSKDETEITSVTPFSKPERSPLPPPTDMEPELVVPKNSGLLPASPPPEFNGEFGTGVGAVPFKADFGLVSEQAVPDNNQIEESIFTGESALTPNRAGPTGDGLGPPILPGAAIPPPVPALGIGGAAAGIPPTPSASEIFHTTHNPPTTLKPSALLSVLNKADIGFNQAISHFEQGTPVESAAIDILEVALGSEKLDSQAKLLGHIDRTIGIDNLQRLQRWANTGGALDALKEQLVKIAKNYSPPENLLPTLPPQLQYLLAPSGK